MKAKIIATPMAMKSGRLSVTPYPLLSPVMTRVMHIVSPVVSPIVSASIERVSMIADAAGVAILSPKSGFSVAVTVRLPLLW